VAPLLAALADFLDPTQGPEQSGRFQTSPSFFIVLFGIGAIVAVVGHVTRLRPLVAAGIILIFLATFLIPVFLQATR
jgi:Flp pilus assembly protein TadB